MKRKVAWVLAVILSICVLTACSSSEYVGEWRYVSGVINGKETSEKEFKEKTGGTVKLLLSNDGNAIVEIYGKRARSKWEETEEGIIVYDRTNKSKYTSYKKQDGQLIYSDGKVEMKLEKK